LQDSQHLNTADTDISGFACGVLLPLRLQTVAYDGSNFAGFQYQTPKVRTVQGELERAAARVLLPAGRVVGASRTDGGAHATCQVAHLDVTGSADSIQPASLMMYMNGVLPDDVKVQQLQVAPAGRWTSRTGVCRKSVCPCNLAGWSLQQQPVVGLVGSSCKMRRGKL
jgi:hypothetical protein